MNEQPIEKRSFREDGVLEVHSIFYTIQGEGPFAGRPCVFVRLAGCNLQCPGCDTEYSSPYKRRFIDPAALASSVLAEFADRGDGRKLVVITGGEPFRQNLQPFLTELIRVGCYAQIETNGTYKPSAFNYETNIDRSSGIYIVVSPKSGKVHPDYHRVACAFKYILSHESVDSDGLPITVLDHTVGGKVARPEAPFMGEIYLQPMDHTSLYPPGDWKTKEANMESLAIVKHSCLTYGYVLQLQIHKIIGVE